MAAKRPIRWLLVLWTVSLLLSYSVRAIRGFQQPALEDQKSLSVQVDHVVSEDGAVEIAYREYGVSQAATPILLLHGNPMGGRAMRTLAEDLAVTHPVLVPDLPGLGFSSRNLTTYSAINQVSTLLGWLDALETGSVDVVAYSQGGAVALELAQRAPDRVRSITLLASVGLQEHELLGSYELNQPVYAVYYAALWSARWLLPHFGCLDDPVFSPTSALNFAQTDLRRNQAAMESLRIPTLILHSPADTVVPYSAAKAHADLIAHAEFIALDGGHISPIQSAESTLPPIRSFLTRVDQGLALTASSTLPSDRSHQPGLAETTSPKAQYLSILSLTALLFLMVFASEDLSCIAGGILAATGALPLWAAILGCFLGIWISDLLLYAVGATFGSRVLNWGPFRRLKNNPEVDRMRTAYASKGLKIVFLTRFLPGSRVAAYIVAGTLHLGFIRFSIWLFVAAAVWTPILVSLAFCVGHPLIHWWESYGLRLLPLIAVSLIALHLSIRALTKSFTYRGRAELRGRWRRLTKWEYWPALPVYLPVFVYGCWLAIRYRSTTVWGLCNPGIEPISGLAMESKSAILSNLNAHSGKLPEWTLLAENSDPEKRLQQFLEFKRLAALDWPVVFKPDVGQRGEGVAIIRSKADAARYLNANAEAIIAQAYASGDEYGVFFTRMPGAKGRIFSITEKRLPQLIGDGERTVERLILDDPRAVAQAKHYLRVNAERVNTTPAKGEIIQLVELGTHCRGAIFLDGNHLASDALAEALNEVVDSFEGFGFGRFDLRVPSAEDLQAGRHFKILELNGVSSESTDIYDPKNSILAGWTKLCRQWALAFKIGDRFRSAGHTPPRPRDVFATIRRHREREHFEAADIQTASETD
ncbi:alpha/beta hydrolase fold protein [Coraliomargarita akajimensis DSM 45221]|uniref:Alpha/beta hydrolase fold protein n=2 Tax=Coraliomargarita TaxID=442430 RepID=D5EKN9_CORAD|nr:alpha/beta hydrolase fold protein [Coraliomargarita akajimensis DSM 45221]